MHIAAALYSPTHRSILHNYRYNVHHVQKFSTKVCSVFRYRRSPFSARTGMEVRQFTGPRLLRSFRLTFGPFHSERNQYITPVPRSTNGIRNRPHSDPNWWCLEETVEGNDELNGHIRSPIEISRYCRNSGFRYSFLHR